MSHSATIPAPSDSEAIPMFSLDEHSSSSQQLEVNSPPPKHTTPSLFSTQYFLGIALLLIVVFLWTLSNFITQNLFVSGYAKPFLVTYLNTSAFALYLIPVAIKHWLNKSQVSSTHHEEYQPLATAQTDDAPNHAHDASLPPLTIEETAKLALFFCFFWFIANWSVNASLDYTSVASTTILSSVSGFFTLGIGRIFRVEVLTSMKIAAVLISFIGVALVSLSDVSQAPAGSTPTTVNSQSSGSKPLLGDALALISALFYALYVILLKVRIGSESRINMQLFFGFVGLFNVLTCWPLGLLLHFTGIEPFGLPSNRNEIGAILLNMFITLSSDFLYVLAMLKTTPLVVTVGLSLTIPLAVIGDFILNQPTTAQVMVGALLVLASFIAIGFEGSATKESDQALVEEAAIALDS